MNMQNNGTSQELPSSDEGNSKHQPKQVTSSQPITRREIEQLYSFQLDGNGNNSGNNASFVRISEDPKNDEDESSAASSDNYQRPSETNYLHSLNKEINYLEQYASNLLQKKVNQNHLKEMKGFCGKIRDLFITCLLDMSKKDEENKSNLMCIQKKTDQCNKLQEKIINVMSQKDNKVNSYADATKVTLQNSHQTSKNTSPSEIGRPNYALFLNNVGDKKEKLKNNELKAKVNEIKNVLKPDELGIGVKSSGATKDGGLIMSFDTEESRSLAAEKLMEFTEETSLHPVIPYKILPKITLLGVGNDLTKEDLQQKLLNQNSTIKESMNEEETFEVIFISRKGNAVLKVSPNIRKIILNKGSLYANMKSYRAIDRFFYKTCFNCHGFGHYAKDCPKDVAICEHCGEEGHGVRDCEKKNDKSLACCVNCKLSTKYKSHTNHRATDNNTCPLHNEQKLKVIRITDFGIHGY